MPNAGQLQRATLRWVQAVDDNEHGYTGLVKYHATITANEVAVNYGVPDMALKKYLKGELEKEESCRTLPFTLLMVISYTLMVIGHDPVVPIHAVEHGVMFDVEENANFAFSSGYIGHKGMYDANSQTDIWSWMINGLAPLVFQQGRGFSEGSDGPPWSNEPEIIAAGERSSKLPWLGTVAREDRGIYLNFDRLIGGMRFRQERGKQGDCETMAKLKSLHNAKCSTRYRGSGYELYPELYTSQGPFDKASEFWLWAHDDIDYSTEVLRKKEIDAWMDEDTKKLEISIPVFNGQFGVYSMLKVNFFFSHGGHIWKRVIPLSTYSQWYYGVFTYIPDAIWGCGLLYIFVSEAYAIYTTWKSAQAVASVSGWTAIRTEYMSLWKGIDWLNVGMGFCVIIGFRIRFGATDELNSDLKRLGLTQEEAERATYRQSAIEIVEKMDAELAQANMFRMLLGTYPLVVVLRLFESFAHQPRLSVVTKAMENCAVDLAHFLIVFGAVFMTAVTAGIIIFGRDVDGFTHAMLAFNTCFRTMMGDFDWDELIQVGRIEGGSWFLAFMVMIVILLLNMLLAIVMDAYSTEKEKIGDAETLVVELVSTFRKFRGRQNGELVTLGQVYKSLRHIRANDKCKKVTVKPRRPENPDKPADKGDRPILKHASSQSTVGHLEEFKLVTIEILMHDCKDLREKQATEVIEAAIAMYHGENLQTTNTDEMNRTLLKVSEGTKDCERRYMKEKGRGSVSEMGSNFESIFDNLLQDLKHAREAIGEQYPEEIPDTVKFAVAGETTGMFHKANPQWVGELHLEKIHTMDEATDHTIKFIYGDKEDVLQMCRKAGLSEDNDDLRIEALSKSARVLDKDHDAGTVLCRIPAVGDLWFPLTALAHSRPKPPDDMEHHYFGQYGHHLSMEEAMLTEFDMEDLIEHKSSESIDRAKDTEAMRKIHDLESELRVGRMTVQEAREAGAELQGHLAEEQKACLLEARKLHILKEKVAVQMRERERLHEELGYQERRIDMVAGAKDDYRHMLQRNQDKQLVRQIFALFDTKRYKNQASVRMLNQDEYKKYLQAIWAWDLGKYNDKEWRETWTEECERLGHTSQGITLEGFEEQLYGKPRPEGTRGWISPLGQLYGRLGKARVDLVKCKKAVEASEALRRQLDIMTVGALKKMAIELGIDDIALMEADYAGNPRSALIELILREKGKNKAAEKISKLRAAYGPQPADDLAALRLRLARADVAADRMADDGFKDGASVGALSQKEGADYVEVIAEEIKARISAMEEHADESEPVHRGNSVRRSRESNGSHRH